MYDHRLMYKKHYLWDVGQQKDFLPSQQKRAAAALKNDMVRQN